MIIELKTKTRLISNRRNRMMLTLVSPVWNELYTFPPHNERTQNMSSTVNELYTFLHCEKTPYISPTVNELLTVSPQWKNFLHFSLIKATPYISAQAKEILTFPPQWSNFLHFPQYNLCNPYNPFITNIFLVFNWGKSLHFL